MVNIRMEMPSVCDPELCSKRSMSLEMSSSSFEAGGFPWSVRSAVTRDDKYLCLPTTSMPGSTGIRCVPRSRKPRINCRLLGLSFVNIACASED